MLLFAEREREKQRYRLAELKSDAISRLRPGASLTYPPNPILDYVANRSKTVTRQKIKSRELELDKSLRTKGNMGRDVLEILTRIRSGSWMGAVKIPAKSDSYWAAKKNNLLTG